MSEPTLPPVYIKRIQIFDNTKEFISLKIHTCIKDQMNENSSWANLTTFEKINTMVVVSSDTALNDLIKKGTITFDEETIRSRFQVGDKIKMFLNPATEGIKTQNNGEVNYLKSYDVKFRSSEPNIEVFCATYFDNVSILRESGMDTNGIRNPTGNINSEIIMTNNIVNTQLTVFVGPKNRQYIGPVHYHESKGYMAGAQHSDQPHDKLQTIQVTNFKIKDYREYIYLSPAVQQNTPVSKYSSLSYSINNQGIVNGIFSINFNNIILNDTKYGHFIRSLSKDARMEILSLLRIKNLKISRKRVDVEETEKIIETYSGPSSAIVQIDNKKAMISEVNLDPTNGIKTYMFSDKHLDRAKIGTYKYEIELAFIDPTVKFVENYVAALRKSVSNIKLYYNEINQNKNYNFENDMVRSNFYESSLTNLNTTTSMSTDWVASNEIYVRGMSYIYELTQQQKKYLTYMNSSKLDPRNATIFSIFDFKEKISSLERRVVSLFDLSKTNPTQGNLLSYPKRATSKNFIFLKKEFSQTIMPSNFIMSYGYISDIGQQYGILNVTKDIFLDRINDEMSKYFHRPPNKKDVEQNNNPYYDITNLNKNKFSYMSPMFLSSQNETLPLDDIRTINIKKLNNFFNGNSKDSKNNNAQKNYALNNLDSFRDLIGQSMIDILGSGNTVGTVLSTAESVSTNTQNTLNLLGATSTSDGDTPDYISSGDYLGNNSLFVRYSENPDPNDGLSFVNNEVEQMQESLGLVMDLNKANNSLYDILFERNLITLAKEQKFLGEFNLFFDSLPNQIRALFMYRYPFVKKLQGPTIEDALQNIVSKITMNINYFKIVKIEVFDGFTRSSDGQIMLNAPIFRTLNTSDVNTLSNNEIKLCRIVPYFSDELKIDFDNLSLPIQNQYFILKLNENSGPVIPPNVQILNDINFIKQQHILTRAYNLDGATSNILAQSGTAMLLDKSSYTVPNENLTVPNENLTVPNENLTVPNENFNEAVGNINRIIGNSGMANMSGGGGSTGGGY